MRLAPDMVVTRGNVRAARSFGGMKGSGIGAEGSKYGIEGFLEVKYFYMGGIDR